MPIHKEWQVLILCELTFDEVMDFYGKHNRDVFRMIVEAQKGGNLSPFVGAGLSCPFGYKLWGGVLAELAEYIPTEADRKMALAQIHNSQYEEAAQTILNAYPFMLDQLPGIVSPDILRTCSEETKRTGAAWVLPLLFPKGLVMTTNFDRVLEHVYLVHRNESIPTVTPMNQDRLDQLCQNQALGLFKLHGDIGSEAVSIDDLVFTGEQYDKHYAANSPLVVALARWFSNRRLLFLGCSLNKDRTMQVLQDVSRSQNGIRHYAILGCKEAEITKRSQELAILGILPIFYDDSNHDALRVILERLLEETNQVAYQELIRTSYVLPPVFKEEHSMLFDSDYFPFSGRDTELKQLEEYCTAEGRILWWAVTGPGGMGKSRLVYEFCKRKRADGWKTERFEAHPSRGSPVRSLEELAAWIPDISKTIVVLDDVQAHMETVCAWLSRMDRTARSEDLRILLLERDGKNLTSASWLGSDPCGDGLDDWCYDENFLHLEPMTDDDLMEIMDNYAAAAGKNLSAQRLLKVLERVDPQLKRPLYAIAIADARCQGKDPVNWDQAKILDTLLARELDFHFNRLQGIDDRKKNLSKKLRTELETLLARVCIRGVLPLDKVDMTFYPALQKRIERAEMDVAEFFDRLGLLRTAQFIAYKVDKYANQIDDSKEEGTEQVMTLSCPDLIKEHLVLKQAFEKNNLDLLPDGWQHDPGHLLFLRRLWVDYPERLKGQTVFWDRFFGVEPPAGLPAWIYGDLLWGCTELLRELAPQAVDCLAGLYGANMEDQQVAVYYAKGLFNLSNLQEAEERAATIDKLEKLYLEHKDWQEVALAYAKGLVNLSCGQKMEDCAATVARLEKVYIEHEDSQDILDCYAMGMSNLALSQNQKDCVKTVSQLQELYNKNSERQRVIIEYVKSLSYLLYKHIDSAAKQLDKYDAIVSELEGLCYHTDIWVSYASEHASALTNLALIQNDVTTVQKTLDLSREVLAENADNEDIQLSHAKTWFNLTLVQKPEDIPATVSDISAFLRSHAGIIPKFKKALDKYLEEHPDHTERYQPLLEL